MIVERLRDDPMDGICTFELDKVIPAQDDPDDDEDEQDCKFKKLNVDSIGISKS